MSAKRIIRELTPPILWKTLHFVTKRDQKQPEEGRERDSSYYDNAYVGNKEYLKHYADSIYYFIWCVLVDRLRNQKPDFVFDVGCGPGQFAAFLRDRGIPNYLGLDFSSESIEMARRMCPEFDFVCEDAHTSDYFSKLSYDTFIATEFFEHIEGDLDILNRVKKGTKVFGSVPNFPNPGHVRHFETERDVANRYEEGLANFKVDSFLLGNGGMILYLFEGIKK